VRSCILQASWRGLSAGYERGRLLSWFLAIRFTFTKITISKINGTRYAIAQPIIPIPDMIIGNSFVPAS
jgi:ABC-type iron transport system FetAB permease component